ncbi:hypothetical protein LGQ02_11560 [Bacillus shivajii]|uniref:hypothetical protein n=1 Tax=Bacillus shivajii TaxID=1983719 RepID=UPI001CF9C21F|nr:hypothetical protein [Bacillus shivajii]UCZ51512.1 hypothetical protein LGQ02_11560 [Bacillus shivajii]
MYIISTFEYSSKLELALSELEQKGIPKENILAFPLDKRVEEAKLFDSIHQSDGMSLFDLAAVFGMIFMLVGSIYGYILNLGPIIWGVIGLIIGLIIGFLIDFYLYKKNYQKKANMSKGRKSEVVIIVECSEEKVEKVEDILWSHLSFGICRVKSNNPIQ